MIYKSYQGDVGVALRQLLGALAASVRVAVLPHSSACLLPDERVSDVSFSVSPYFYDPRMDESARNVAMSPKKTCEPPQG